MVTSSLEAITRDDILKLCGSTIYGRGQSYLRAGTVQSTTVERGILKGEVNDSRPQPYKVSVKITEDGLESDCDCPHEALYCKHVCALLLAWVESPRSFIRIVPSDEFESGPHAPLDLQSDPDNTRIGMATSFDRSKARKDVAGLLRSLTLEDLRTMSRRIGMFVGSRSKEDAVEYLANLYTDPELIRSRLLALGKEERLILDIIHLAGGSPGLTYERIQVRLKAFGLLTAAARIAVTLGDLFAQGLVVPGANPHWNSSNVFKAPEAVSAELFAHSISYLLKPYRFKEENREVVVQTKPLDESLYLVWSYLAQNRVAPRPVPQRSSFEEQREGIRGWHNSPGEILELERNPKQLSAVGFSLAVLPSSPALEDTDLRKLAGMLAGGEDEVLFLYQLLWKLSLVEDKGHIVAHEEKMQAFLRLPRSERLQTIARAWPKMDRWVEAFLLGSCARKAQVRRLAGPGGLKRDEFQRQLMEGLQFVASAIARLEGNKWHSCQAVLETLHTLHPDFLVRPAAATGNRPYWWFKSLATGKDLDPYSRDDWLEAEGEFILSLLRGPLLWSGMVDLAHAGGKLEAFRTTGLAPLLVGGAPVLGEAEGKVSVEVGADLSVAIASGAGDAAAHAFLSRLGTLVDANPTRFRYRLAPERVARAFEEGVTVANIVDFLVGYGAAPTPEIVRNLERWWASYGLIRLYDNLTVVEFADDYALKELRATTSIGQYIIFEFSPRVVAISPDAVDKLAAEITRKGYTPKIVEGQP